MHGPNHAFCAGLRMKRFSSHDRNFQDREEADRTGTHFFAGIVTCRVLLSLEKAVPVHPASNQIRCAHFVPPSELRWKGPVFRPLLPPGRSIAQMGETRCTFKCTTGEIFNSACSGSFALHSLHHQYTNFAKFVQCLNFFYVIPGKFNTIATVRSLYDEAVTPCPRALLFSGSSRGGSPCRRQLPLRCRSARGACPFRLPRSSPAWRSPLRRAPGSTGTPR